ncbi:MAG: arginine--tRNA ligase [Gammaproteobacteria bacterium]|nr:arginine--tRNA ligase [Gammaproteobacteria bacterium]
MKQAMTALLQQALQQLQQQGQLPETIVQPLIAQQRLPIERCRDRSHGDYASNLAMLLAKEAKMAPRNLAQLISSALPASELIAKCEIAGPGFINFTLSATARRTVVNTVLSEASRFGHNQSGAGKRVLLEFVSANPTGPLHVGHGRGAAYGSALAALLATNGYQVECEYYVNDAGRQMDILATSVWLRYLELCGESLSFPKNGYKGDYVWDIAATLHRTEEARLHQPITVVMADIPADAGEEEASGGDKELHIDALIARAKLLLGEEGYRTLFDAGLNAILEDIRQDLAQFGVHFQRWYSERTLIESGAVERALERLQTAGYLYQQEGATWFRSTAFGDEKDRVLVRENGAKTYFASDIAYHLEKLERGYTQLIDIWGADHHGYVPRVKAAMAALGADPGQLEVLLVQFAILYRHGERMQMSTRSGEFVTLRELREEVGNDAARLFYMMRRCEQHLDFDLDLAKSQSSDNPIYYIQYAHARICSVLNQLESRGIPCHATEGLTHLNLLQEPQEEAIFTTLSRYPEMLEGAAKTHEPHQLVHYLRDLANDLHSLYNAHQFIVEDPQLRAARLSLALAVKQVLANGLAILGLHAPEKM